MKLGCAADYDPESHVGIDKIRKFLSEAEVDVSGSLTRRGENDENGIFKPYAPEEIERLIGCHMAIRIMQEFINE